jgi:hypothetical protein
LSRKKATANLGKSKECVQYSLFFLKIKDLTEKKDLFTMAPDYDHDRLDGVNGHSHGQWS